MRRTATDPDAVALLDDLDVTCSRLAATQAESADLLTRRNRLFVELKARNVTQREMAERAGLTEMAVKKAIDKTTCG